MNKYLVTVQAWVWTDSAQTAENIAIETATYLEEANENPDADDTIIQTCIAEKEPFRVATDNMWSGASVEGDIDK